MSKSNLPKRMITTALATGGFAIAGALAFGPSAEAAENPVPNTAQDADAIDLDKIEKEADDLIAELEAAPPKPPADAPAEADPVQNAEPPPAQDTQQVPENPGQQNSETQSEPEDSATSDEDGDDDGVKPRVSWRLD